MVSTDYSCLFFIYIILTRQNYVALFCILLLKAQNKQNTPKDHLQTRTAKEKKKPNLT